MIVVGVVGGVASGKSSVTDALGKLGAAIIHADRIGHEVLKEPAVVESLRERWGERVFGADGLVDRKAAASIVFGPPPEGPRELRFLESLTHPRIDARIHEPIRQLSKDRKAVTVLDAPVLLEAGWARHCDRILFVEVDRAERLRRAYQRGWSEAEFAAREAAQLSLEEKRKVADEVIDNSASFDHTLAQIQQFWRSLNIPPE
jgi:dephospho-CoA kinase